MKLHITTLIILLSVASPGLTAQYTEQTYPFVPPEMRRIIAMDMTSELEPTVVGVGDGVVTSIPGSAFTDITSTYRTKVFNGVALVSNTTGIVSTTDNILVAIDIPSRSEANITGFPAIGTNIVRCGSFAFALRDGYVIRLSITGNSVQIDTVKGIANTVTMLSAADFAHAVAYDSTTRTLQLIDASSNAVVVSRQLDREATFLQALSDSVSLVFVIDTITDQGAEQIVRPLRAIWHYSNQERDIYGHDPQLYSNLLARFSASLHGGGAVVVAPGSNNKSKTSIYYATGGRIDSTQRTTIGNNLTNEIHAGVAWWYRKDLQPQWHMSGTRFTYARLDADGTISQDRAHFVPRRCLAQYQRTLTLTGSDLLVITTMIEETDDKRTLRPHLFASVDGGFSWSMRPIPKLFDTYAVAVGGEIIASAADSILRSSIYSSTNSVIHRIDTSASAIAFNGDTIVVCSKFIHISVDGGTTWKAWSLEEYRSGHPSRVFDRTIVLTTPFRSCVSHDLGRSWRDFSFATREKITSAMVLLDSTVYGAWSLPPSGVVSRDDGKSYGMPLAGDLINFRNDNAFFGTSTGMRGFEAGRGSIGPTVFTLDPYAYHGSVNFNRPFTQSLPPVYNNVDNAYFMMRDRIKRITQVTPSSVQDEHHSFAPYPNPASTFITIPDGEATFSTLMGTVIFVVDANASRSIDVSTWPSGTYLLESKNGYSRKAVPVVIVH
ncbi:MAG: T9SS type A sorting domain-containing protein [Ignavibacteria bacterium]|nr:T9SS type A sorting domain-containing protein [Ignavibacteria bacterium]